MAPAGRGESGKAARTSLRTEFVFHLAFLATAGVLLAFGTARALENAGAPLALIALLVAAVVATFVLVGNHLIERWIVRPLAEIGRSAESIAAGRYEQRVPEAGPDEIVSLARALNHLTDQLLKNQDLLAENIRSLDETNRRLTEAHAELVQAEKMASLGRLAAGIAHEIGNPLGALLGYVSVQKRRGGDPELISGLEREARRIDRIVRGLLDYARPGTALRESLDVNESIRRVVGMLREQGWLREVEVRLELEALSCRVAGDPHRLDQVFVNLLRNAESAMAGRGVVWIRTTREVLPPGEGVPVRRAEDPPGVNYAHLRRRSGVRGEGGVRRFDRSLEGIKTTITDSGPGIPEEHLGAVFDPFFTTKEPGEGTGLGLAIVAGTVAEMGGKVEVSNQPGRGASFSIWLPAEEVAA